MGITWKLSMCPDAGKVPYQPFKPGSFFFREIYISGSITCHEIMPGRSLSSINLTFDDKHTCKIHP